MEIEISTYHDFWMDNGIENLYTMLANVDGVEAGLHEKGLNIKITEKEAFIKGLEREIKDRRDSIILVKQKDEKTGEIRQIRKDFILLQRDKNIGVKNTLKERIYVDGEITTRLENILENLEGDKNTCVICNRNYLRPVDNLKQAIYPHVTKIKSLNGIRKQKDNYGEICPLCYLIGSLEWCDEGMIYRVFLKNGSSFVLFPQTANLKELHDFKKGYSGTLLNNMRRYSNIRVLDDSGDVENTPGEYSTLLCMYGKFMSHACTSYDELRDVIKQTCTNWNYMEIPLGTVKNIKETHININKDILSVINTLVVVGQDIYLDLIKKTTYLAKTSKGMKSDWDKTNTVRENLSKTLLLDDFRGFTRAMLPKNKGKMVIKKEASQVLENLLYNWRIKKMGLEAEDLGTIKSVANIIAETSLNNVSLLYKVDKARNLDDFWNALREVSRKMISLDKAVKATSLDHLIELIKCHEKDWEEIRNLLVIYSCMYYSIKSYKEGAKE